MIHSRPASPDDAETIRLRAESLAEFQRLSIADPVALMRQVIEASGVDAVTYLDPTGNTLAVAGVTQDPQCRRLYPWLLASAPVEKHPRALLLIGRALVAFLRDHRQGREVCGYIGKASHSSRAFIERLGFHIVSAPSGETDFFQLPANV